VLVALKQVVICHLRNSQASGILFFQQHIAYFTRFFTDAYVHVHDPEEAH